MDPRYDVYFRDCCLIAHLTALGLIFKNLSAPQQTVRVR